MRKTTCIITEDSDYDHWKSAGILKFSNKQWLSNPAALEGCEFGDVIIKCTPDEELRKWLHMHLGIRIERIIYT